MNRPLLLLAPLLLSLSLPALRAADAEDTAQKTADDFVAAIQSLEKLISPITDDASAKTASPEIEKQVDKLAAVVERMKKFPKPGEAVAKKLAEDLKASDKRMEPVMRNLQEKNPAAVETLLKSLAKIPGDFPPGWSVRDAKPDESAPPAPPAPPAPEAMPK